MVFVVIGESRGDGLGRSPFEGPHDTAAPGSPGTVTGDRGMRHRAPVSDHPGRSLLTVLSLPRPRSGACSVGIDWASRTHAVCVLDDAGRMVTASPSSTPPTGSPAWRPGWPPRCPATLPVGDRAPGRPAGRPAAGGRASGGAGQDQGHQGLARSRGALGRQVRPGRRRGDRRVPAAAAAPAARLRCRSPPRPGRCARSSRTRDRPGRPRVAATNQLAALLEAFWPGAEAIFADVASPISLAFLTRYPTPPRPPAWASAHGGVLCQARLLRSPHRRRPARAAARRPRRHDRTGEVEARRDAVPAMVRVLARSTPRSRTSTAPWSPTWASTRTPRSSRRCHAPADQRRPDARRVGRLPRQPTTDQKPSPPWPGWRRSPAAPASTAA